MGYLVRNFTCIPTFSGKFAAFHFAGTHCAVPNELAQTSERWIHLPGGRSGRSANPADGIGIDCKTSPIRKSLCDSLNATHFNPFGTLRHISFTKASAQPGGGTFLFGRAHLFSRRKRCVSAYTAPKSTPATGQTNQLCSGSIAIAGEKVISR